MNTKSLTTMMCVFALSLLLAGCRPAPLSDEEFSESAQGTCQTLMTEMASLDPLDHAAKAEAYRRAAEALAEFEISEESAPQGMLLRTSLAELAEAHGNFAGALTEALAQANIDGASLLLFTESGNVFTSSSGTVFDMVALDIDPELVIELNTRTAEVHAAATALGLEQCAPSE
jgi:hypothetical protein